MLDPLALASRRNGADTASRVGMNGKSTIGRVLAFILVLLLLVLLTILNPWLLVAAVVGTFVGVFVRARFSRSTETLSTQRGQDALTPSSEPRHDDGKERRRIYAVSLVVGLLLLAVLAIFPFLWGERAHVPCPRTTYSVLYQGSAAADPAKGRWEITDRLLVASDLLATTTSDADHAASKRELKHALAGLSWHFDGLQDKNLVFSQTRQQPLSNGVVPLLSATAISIPEVSWGGCLNMTRLEPGKESILTVVAPAHVVVHTFPKTDGEDMLNNTWQWKVPADASLTDDGVIRIQTSSRWARNAVTAMAADLSVPSLAKGIVVLIFIAIGKLIDEMLDRPIRRLFERLHLVKPEVTKPGE
jgi:hypothetical protein